MFHAYNPNTLEAETGGLSWVQCLHGLHTWSRARLQNKNQKQIKLNIYVIYNHIIYREKLKSLWFNPILQFPEDKKVLKSWEVNNLQTWKLTYEVNCRTTVRIRFSLSCGVEQGATLMSLLGCLRVIKRNQEDTVTSPEMFSLSSVPEQWRTQWSVKYSEKHDGCKLHCH